jgi:hypothetical protein
MEKLIEPEQQESEESAEVPETAPTESEPQEAERNTNHSESHLPIYAALLLVAVGLIVGLIFLARWIYHATKHNTGANKPSSSQSQSKKGSSTSSGSSNPIVVGGGQSNNSQKSPTSIPKNGQSLPNNGPGNVIGVFAAASFAAGALHYIVSLRKAARED